MSEGTPAEDGPSPSLVGVEIVAAGGSQWRGTAGLVLVTLLWGTTFVVIRAAVGEAGGAAGQIDAGAQGAAGEALAPSALLALRFGIASLVFAPFLRRGWRLWRGGLELSFWLWVGYAAQTVGLQTTTASSSAFITSLSAILVPLFLRAAGRSVGPVVWLAASLAFVGVGLLSWDGGSPVIGDLWTLGTALAYAIYLIRVERMTWDHDALALTGVQMVGVFALSGIWFGVDRPAVGEIPWVELAYLGVVCSAAVVWLQMKAQRLISAARAAVIFTLEPVWAALFAFALLGERLAWMGWVGALMVIGATLLGQLPDRKKTSEAVVSRG